MKCQPDGGVATAALSSKPFASLVEGDSEPARGGAFGGHGNSGDVPFAALLDRQRPAAVASSSCAIMPQRRSAVAIGRASDDAALGIRHQNQRMILLVATEHDGAADLRHLPYHRQYAISRAEPRGERDHRPIAPFSSRMAGSNHSRTRFPN